MNNDRATYFVKCRRCNQFSLYNYRFDGFYCFTCEGVIKYNWIFKELKDLDEQLFFEMEYEEGEDVEIRT